MTRPWSAYYLVVAARREVVAGWAFPPLYLHTNSDMREKVRYRAVFMRAFAGAVTDSIVNSIVHEFDQQETAR